MQTWVWGEHFPDAMDALAPVASMPVQISGRNLMWREIVIRAILDDPDWRGGDYDPASPPTRWAQIAAPLFAVMVSNPQRLQEAGPTGPRRLPTMTNWSRNGVVTMPMTRSTTSEARPTTTQHPKSVGSRRRCWLLTLPTTR